MHARTRILTAAAMLAFAVPAVAGASSVTANTTFRVTKETTALHGFGQSLPALEHRAIKTGKGSKRGAGKSSKPAVKPIIYIVGVGPKTPPIPVIDPNECQDSGNNCTDQQACQYWGMNCGSVSVTTDQTATQPAAPATSATDAGNTASPSPSTATTGFNASNCSDYYDYINTGDGTYC